MEKLSPINSIVYVHRREEEWRIESDKGSCTCYVECDYFQDGTRQEGMREVVGHVYADKLVLPLSGPIQLSKFFPAEGQAKIVCCTLRDPVASHAYYELAFQSVDYVGLRPEWVDRYRANIRVTRHPAKDQLAAAPYPPAGSYSRP